MIAKRTKLFVLILLILSVFAICTLITSGKTRITALNPSDKLVKTPLRMVSITLAQNLHDQLFEQLRRFAAKHGFAIRISQTDPTGENFLVRMTNEDIEIVGLDSGDPGLFEIWLYNAYEERPVPSSVFDELIAELKEYIAEIPNTTFTVEEVK